MHSWDSPVGKERYKAMDTKAVSNVSEQLIKVCETINSLSVGMYKVGQNAADLKSVYTDLVLAEIKHAQLLTLELTKLATVDGEATE